MNKFLVIQLEIEERKINNIKLTQKKKKHSHSNQLILFPFSHNPFLHFPFEFIYIPTPSYLPFFQFP